MRRVRLASLVLMSCTASGFAWAGLCTATPGLGGCAGCCLNGCQPGDSGEACGSNGGACVTCAASLACIDGQCVQPSCGLCFACCQSDGTCAPSASNQQCGLAGAPCVACASGATCTLGVCLGLCDPAHCPNGCCDSTGNCQSPSDATCGAASTPCADCSLGGGFCSPDAGYQCVFFVDAGTDGGTPDSGPSDAGTPDAGGDGGVFSDAGLGQPDAGPSVVSIARLGCNCGVGGPLWFALGSCLALARHRVRRRRSSV